GDQILLIEKLSIPEYFAPIDLNLERGDKVAVIGKQQLAISMFLSVLGNVHTDFKGTFQFGTTISMAYLPNHNESYFETNLNLIDWLRQFSKEKDETYIRGFLGKMLFSGEEVLKSCRVLSGGERVRCMLSRMMLLNPNVLIMDEPTNHLDLESITALNDALIEFPGSILFTSHDHQLTQTVANRILELGKHKCMDKRTTYDTYLTNESWKAQRLALH
ncbi:MAG: ATP-binding cassette domain-containing protein, partial [Bacteroidia bacterium]